MGASVIGLITSGAGLAAGKYLARIFTDEEAILDLAAQISPFLWGSYVLLRVGFQLMGILEGSSRATEQAVVFFLGPWVVGLPVAFATTYATSLGLQGLWASTVIGWAVITCAGCVLVARSDWQALADEAMERAEEEKEAGAEQ